MPRKLARPLKARFGQRGNDMDVKQTTILHNPRCSKSRAAVQWLQSRGVDFQVIKYLETPLTHQQLAQVVRLLGIDPVALVRKQEPIFKELGLGDKTLGDDEWLAILAKNPQLIERPIVLHDGKAAIGRPVEKLAEILDPQG